VVKYGPELSSWVPQYRHLASWATNLLGSCRNFGLWLPELCSEVLNPETLWTTNLAQSHYLLVLRLQMCFKIIFAYCSTKHYHNWNSYVSLLCNHRVL